MQNHSPQTLFVKAAALALLALFFIQSNAYASHRVNITAAQTPTGTFRLTFNGQTTGIARGQTLRLTASNGNEPASPGGGGRVLAQAILFDAHGATIAESREVDIPPGEFRSFDFDRDQLSLEGEPATGRVQARSQIRYRFFSIVDRTQLSRPSIEIIDNNTGMTVIAMPDARAADDMLGPDIANDIAIGIIPGQTLRLSLFNPSDPDSREGSEPIRAQVKVFDSHGLLIAESAEVFIPAGEFRSFDFQRSDLPLAGDPGTSRAQIRTMALWGVSHHRFAPDQIPASVEIVDNGTGRTTAATSTKPKEIVVVGS